MSKLKNSFKVWCMFHRGFEEHEVFLQPSGELFYLFNGVLKPLNMETHFIKRFVGCIFGVDVYEFDEIEVSLEDGYSNVSFSSESINYSENLKFKGRVVFDDFSWLVEHDNLWVPIVDIIAGGMEFKKISDGVNAFKEKYKKTIIVSNPTPKNNYGLGVFTDSAKNEADRLSSENLGGDSY